MALVASLQEELAALHQHIDNQECWLLSMKGTMVMTRTSARQLGVISVVSGALSQTRCQAMNLRQTPLAMCHAP